MTDSRLEAIRVATEADEVMTALKQIILKGWPDERIHAPPLVPPATNNKWKAEIPARRLCGWVTEGWLDTLSVAAYRLRNKGIRCAVVALRF